MLAVEDPEYHLSWIRHEPAGSGAGPWFSPQADAKGRDAVLIQTESMPWREVYKLLIGAVVPRPIALVSTRNNGCNNLAPFSFFNAVCANPPLLAFAPLVRGGDGTVTSKDTLANIEATGEFVINVVTEDLAIAANACSGEYPPEVDEFQVAGLTPVPCSEVSVPRVAESPINFACRLHQALHFGTDPGGGSLVIGRVVAIHVRDDILNDGRIDIGRLRPVARLSGLDWCRVGETFSLKRPSV